MLSTMFMVVVSPTVKNGFSDPTKVKKGWDRQRKDIEGDRQGKALKEGCCERRWVSRSVPNAKSTLVARIWALSASPHRPPSGLLRLVQPHGPVLITPDWTHGM